MSATAEVDGVKKEFNEKERKWEPTHKPETKESKQISQLANFIMAEIPGEPSQDEGAVDCAIRIMKRNNPTRPIILGAVARGWCHDKNAKKEMDSDLAKAIAQEIVELLNHKGEPK